jgi:prepilin-type N-terminal cleavage/methylation domain-containing protein
MIRRDEGFTLIEVLVALTIAGLIGSALAGLSSFFANLEARAEAREAAMRDVLAFRRLFQTSVENSFPLGAIDPETALRNDSGRLELLTRGPAGLAADEPAKMNFHIVSAGAHAALEVSWQDRQSGAQTETVLRGADRIAFSYLERVGGKPVWHASWADPSRQPEAILAHVDIAQLGGPLDIIARPVSALPGACLALPRFPKCQEAGW